MDKGGRFQWRLFWALMGLVAATLGVMIPFSDWCHTSLGPWLASLDGWSRAGLGALVGAALVTPAFVAAVPRRLALKWCLGIQYWFAIFALLVPAGLGGRSSPDASSTYRHVTAAYLAQANWFVLTSLLVFGGGSIATVRRILARARANGAAPSADD